MERQVDVERGKEPFFIWNGSIRKENEAVVCPTSEGLLYGFGCFETMALRNGAIRYFSDHWKRLGETVEALGISVTVGPDDLMEQVSRLAKQNQCSDGVARFSLHLRGEETDWMVRVYPSGLMVGDQPLRIGVSRFPHQGYSPISYWKHNNYLVNIMAFREARRNGWDEALLLSEGRIVEGTLSNFWLLREGRLITPPLESGALAGVIRGRLIRNSALKGEAIAEEEIRLEDLRKADELFLSSASMEVRPIQSITERQFPVHAESVKRLLNHVCGSNQ
ncbi:MAG: aminotransferase class IV [Verrucomicrobiota bacterium]